MWKLLWKVSKRIKLNDKKKLSWESTRCCRKVESVQGAVEGWMITTVQQLFHYKYLLYFQFNSLFSNVCDLHVTLVLWDVYMLTSDPFLLFFLPLVLLVNAKYVIIWWWLFKFGGWQQCLWHRIFNICLKFWSECFRILKKREEMSHAT